MIDDQQDARLRELYRELETRGQTKDGFDSLYAEAKKVVGDYTPALEGIVMHGLRHGFLT